MKVAKTFPNVLVNIALLGITAKMYWYDHLFPLWAAIVTVVVMAILLNTLVFVSVRRALRKMENRPYSK